MSLLPLARISKFFVVNYMPNTPIGSTNVSNNKLIKLKGNLAFPRKPSHPRGLLQGHPPPQKKWSHFFAKTRKRAKYDCLSGGGAWVAKRKGRASQR
jgi:hypothetical protein